jgi:DNA-binding response OmpR family regulator
MRLLLVAEPPSLAEAVAEDLRSCGVELQAHSTIAEATAVLRRTGAERVVVAADLEGRALRRLVSRLRHAAERMLPIALMVQSDSAWLRTRPPADLGSVAVLPPDARAPAVVGALERLETALERAGAVLAGAGAQLDLRRRTVSGPSGTAVLTPYELALAWRLADAGGAVVGFDELARAVWGEGADRYRRAALRTHVHALRPKLLAADEQLGVVSVPRAGYRLDGTLRGSFGSARGGG